MWRRELTRNKIYSLIGIGALSVLIEYDGSSNQRIIDIKNGGLYYE